LAMTPVDLGLATAAVAHQAQAITHELSQLPGLRRGDPTLGQAPQPEHRGEVLGVALVILYPAVPPVVPKGMGQMDIGAELFEEIGRPIPAVGGLQYHLRLGSGLGHRFCEFERLTRDAHTAEHPPVIRHPVNGRAATVQIDSNVLSLHRGLPCRGLV